MKAKVLLVGMAVAAAVWAAPARAQENGYAGGEACKTCHEKVYDAWAATKHAKAINRLSGSEKADRCITCHVTGTPEMIARDGANPTFPNVQCEACHGMGKLHVANAPAAMGIVRKPAERTCTACHNDTSPHFRGFFYNAMTMFIHKTK